MCKSELKLFEVLQKAGGMCSLKEKVEELERAEIEAALSRTGGVKAKAAKILGITERMIGYKIKKYGIKRIGEGI